MCKGLSRLVTEIHQHVAGDMKQPTTLTFACLYEKGVWAICCTANELSVFSVSWNQVSSPLFICEKLGLCDICGKDTYFKGFIMLGMTLP